MIFVFNKSSLKYFAPKFCLWFSVSTQTVGVVMFLSWYMLIKLCCTTLRELLAFLHLDWSSEFLACFIRTDPHRTRLLLSVFLKRHVYHWIAKDAITIIIDRPKIIWFRGTRLGCHFLFHVIFLNIHYITHRIFLWGFSTKGDEPAKAEFPLLVLPEQFSKFEGAKRHLHC